VEEVKVGIKRPQKELSDLWCRLNAVELAVSCQFYRTPSGIHSSRTDRWQSPGWHANHRSASGTSRSADQPAVRAEARSSRSFLIASFVQSLAVRRRNFRSSSSLVRAA